MEQELIESGIEWIGKYPKGWKVGRVKFFCERIVGGGTPKSTVDEYFDNGTIVWVTPTDFSKFKNQKYINNSQRKLTQAGQLDSSSHLLPIGSVLMSSRASIGEAKIASTELCTNQGFINFIPGSRLNGSYLYYVINEHLGDYFNGIASGSTFNEISRRQVRDERILMPPKPEQAAIAAHLDRVCARIDTVILLKQRQVKKLEEVWSSKIKEATKIGVNGNYVLVDSGVEHLGKIPVHWPVKQFKHVFDVLDHKRVPLSGEVRAEMTDKTYDYYGASGVIGKVENYIYDEPLLLIAEDGANLLSRSSRLVFIAEGKYWVNNHAHVFKPKYGNMRFWAYYLESLDYSIYVTGAAQPKLNAINLGNMRIAVPSVQEQDEMADYLERLERNTVKAASKLNCQISVLQAYRRSLIHEYVTGKKRVVIAEN